MIKAIGAGIVDRLVTFIGCVFSAVLFFTCYIVAGLISLYDPKLAERLAVDVKNKYANADKKPERG